MLGEKKCDQYKNLALKAIFSLFLFHVVVVVFFFLLGLVSCFFHSFEPIFFLYVHLVLLLWGFNTWIRVWRCLRATSFVIFVFLFCLVFHFIYSSWSLFYVQTNSVCTAQSLCNLMLHMGHISMKYFCHILCECVFAVWEANTLNVFH